MRTRPTIPFLFVLMLGASVYIASSTDYRSSVHRRPPRGEPSYTVTLLAFGDVNLGRTLGQQLLREGPECVFNRFRVDSADIVFVNLECPLSDQGGETESPSSNYIFTGPPVGALALAGVGITHAATANNHAFDYGVQAVMETLDNLDAANIGHAGTSRSAAGALEPLGIEKNGLKLALFAVTEFMNMGVHWRRHAAPADSSLLFPAIRKAARWADAVIVSVHGGDEYAEAPSARTAAFMRRCIDQGALLVLGHHPHVPYGIDTARGGYIVQSLGNFVFSQPQREWTQMSYGVLFEFSRRRGAPAVALKRIIPIEVGFQPARMREGEGRDRILARAQKYSTISLKQFH